MTRRRALLAAAAGLAARTARAQGLALAGRMGDKALLVIDGQPHTVAVGGTAAGVRLLGWRGEAVELERAGQRVVLQLGGTPIQVGSTRTAGAAREIVIPMGPGGHFVTGGSINGRALQFMVDTGATLVSIGQADASRLGLDLAGARAGMTQTANGPVPIRMLVLSAVRVGAVEVAQVGAAVLPMPMPYVLLGNSFLSRFQMQRDNDIMRLTLR